MNSCEFINLNLLLVHCVLCSAYFCVVTQEEKENGTLCGFIF